MAVLATRSGIAMTIDWTHAKRIFLEARALAPDARGAFLHEACSEAPELRDAVRGMLAHDDESFLCTPALGAPFKVPTAQAVLETEGLPTFVPGYRLLEVLGEGASGIVYKAEGHEEAATPGGDRRHVAIKVLKSGIHATNAMERFRKEIRVLHRLDHPAIAKILDAGVCPDDDRLWFAMDYVDGRPIDGLRSDLSTTQRIRLLAQIASAIGHAHAQGVVHRDLKPANILIDADGEPHIVDFGIARVLDSNEAQLTASGQILGTVPYMSPSQLSGRSAHVDRRMDVYALGVVAYEFLTGRLPFEHQGLDALVLSIRTGRARRLRRVDPALPAELETIVHCAMDPDPERRYPDANALAADLERVLSGETITARQIPARVRARRFVAQHRGLVAGLTLAFVTLVAGIVVTLLALNDALEQRRLAEARLVTIEAEQRKAIAERKAADLARNAANDAKLAATDARLRAERVRDYLTFMMEVGPPASLESILRKRSITLKRDFPDDLEARADVGRAIAIGLWGYGDERRAYALMTDACRYYVETFGTKDERSLKCRADFFRMSVDLELPVAKEIGRAASDAREVLGVDHDITIRLDHQCVRELSKGDDLAKAEARIRALIPRCIKKYGATARISIDSRCALARALFAADRKEEAEKLFRSSQRIARRWAAHPHASGVVGYNHGTILLATEPERGLRLLEASLDELRKRCGHGEECAIELSVHDSIAKAHAKLGHLDEARAAFETVLRGRTKIHGAASAKTLNAVYQLGTFEIERGELESASRRLRASLKHAYALPDGSELRDRYLTTTAQCLRKLGDDRRAGWIEARK